MTKYVLILALFCSFSVFAEEEVYLSPEEIEGLEFKDPEFITMENFSVERKNGKMYIGFDYVINNPNWFGIKIKPSSLFLTIAGQDIGWVRIEDKIKLKGKTEAGYPFLVIGDASNFVKSMFSSIWGILTGQGIDFNLKGKIKAGVFLFAMKWKMDYTYKMTNEEFMSFF